MSAFHARALSYSSNVFFAINYLPTVRTLRTANNKPYFRTPKNWALTVYFIHTAHVLAWSVYPQSACCGGVRVCMSNLAIAAPHERSCVVLPLPSWSYLHSAHLVHKTCLLSFSVCVIERSTNTWTATEAFHSILFTHKNIDRTFHKKIRWARSRRPANTHRRTVKWHNHNRRRPTTRALRLQMRFDLIRRWTWRGIWLCSGVHQAQPTATAQPQHTTIIMQAATLRKAEGVLLD